MKKIVDDALVENENGRIMRWIAQKQLPHLAAGRVEASRAAGKCTQRNHGSAEDILLLTFYSTLYNIELYKA